MKNINIKSMYGEKFYQIHAAQRQLLRTLNNMEKTDPLDIERTYNIIKQQTRFFWVCSWEQRKEQQSYSKVWTKDYTVVTFEH